ncbi:pyridoxal phosphate-dependent aminotransferase [Actinoallomurus rhizosphaericola]|uniref:pyridoxal phosphate-dependent aminotransferase n=1 Tax=Actinoallomurus rhizosphaericola TaxID=2952536 RepID=UPI002091D662|nr:pyridoxal phosphate-dependent aminotransferase [Actinoallomurus rhizosphaericola]MCO5993795.1 pyridoxal phosphate-dependent aminotransferase [Actinoallomurus rhizosphaericola]
MQVSQSDKLANVLYDIRGPVLKRAMQLEAQGHQILKLHIGNPAPFGFEAPDEILQDVIRNLPMAHGYSDSKGILSARRAVVQHYEQQGFPGVGVDDVYLGNGVSELIVLALQALLNNGDEVLIPAPDYPLWTAAVSLCGGTPVHYLCDEGQGWMPDLADIEAKITPATKAIVIINPNNPTGAVYSRELLQGVAELARRRGLLILADEIYDRILYDGAEHVSIAPLAPDVLSLTFSGLSKAYRVCGFRSGWMVVSGPKDHAESYIEGLDMLANMRLCPNVPGQHAIQAALGGHQSIRDLVLPGGRLREQRDRAWRLLNEIPGVSCAKPSGALYVFPRLDPEVYPIEDDQRFVLDLLESQQILVVQGTGFNWPSTDHFRIVTLQHADDLEEAIGRLGEFLATRRA